MSNKIAVIRIRGRTGVEAKISRTLELLKLKKLYNCTVLDDTPVNLGMIKKAQNYVTWGEIDEKTFVDLVKKRGRIGSKKLSEELIRELNYKSIEDLAKSIYSKKADIKILSLPFKLKPPRKGFERKGIRFKYKEGGSLGYRGTNINNLIRRMI